MTSPRRVLVTRRQSVLVTEVSRKGDYFAPSRAGRALRLERIHRFVGAAIIDKNNPE
jgi:hypothetical protein